MHVFIDVISLRIRLLCEIRTVHCAYHFSTIPTPLTILLFQHAGDMTEAVHWVDEARTMDLADRYLNCKAAKYMLRAGMIDKAEEACALFTRVNKVPIFLNWI